MAYFAFHFDDIMRVNNVRNIWRIDHPDRGLARGFYDSSLWEDREREGDDALKRLIREGVQQTSVICVLVGKDTWSRRWVRYEIARSVIDERGLLAVHLNGIAHHQRRAPDPLGSNPLDWIGIYASPGGKYFLWECCPVQVSILGGRWEWRWKPYEDWTDAVPLPRYLIAPQPNSVVALSSGCNVYDFAVGLGHRNIGGWIDAAALAVGR